MMSVSQMESSTSASAADDLFDQGLALFQTRSHAEAKDCLTKLSRVFSIDFCFENIREIIIMLRNILINVIRRIDG